MKKDPAGMVVCDLKGLVVEINPPGCIALGRERDELLGQPLRKLLPMLAPPFSGLPLVGREKVAIKGGRKRTVDIEANRLSDALIAIRLRPVPEAAGIKRAPGHAGAILRAAFDAMPEGMLIVSASGRITHYNRRFLEIWSIPPDHPAVRKRDDTALIALVADQVLAGEDFPQRIQAIYRSVERTEDLLRLRDGRVLERLSFPLPQPAGAEPERVWQFRDITARKQAEAAVEKRLDALARPTTDTINIGFEGLFDLGEIQQIQDHFAQATGVASIITRPDGTPITRPSNFCRLCKDIIRKTPAGLANCYCSDAALGRHHPGGPIIQPCLSGGLWDAGASITVDGHHLANWLIGQVRDETQSEERMREYARVIGADEVELLAAFRQVPAMSREQFERVAQALYTFSSRLSGSAYLNLQLARHIAERKQAEAALQAKTDELDRYFTGSLDLLCIASASTGKFLRLNPEWEKTFGYPLADLLQRQFIELVHPDDRAATQAAIARLTDQSEVLRFANRFRCQDGSYRWIEWNSRPAGDRIYAVARDITARKTAEETLQTNLQETQQLMDSMANAFVVWGMVFDEQGRPVDLCFDYFNDAYARMAGLTFADVQGKGVREVWPDTEPAWLEFYGEVARTGVSRQFELPHAPTKGMYAGTAYRPGASPARVCAVFEEITVRKRAEESLRASEQRFRRMFEHNRAVMLLIDPDSGRIAEANPAAAEFYGYDREALCRMRIDEINMLPAEQVRAQREQAIIGDRSLFVFPHRLASGEIRTVEVRSSPVEVGDRPLLFSIIQDITERRQAEAAAQQANRQLRMLSECNEASIRATDETELLDTICRIVVETGGYLMAWVGFAEDDAAKTVRPVAFSGLDGEALHSLAISWADNEHGQGPTGRAIRTGRACPVQHIPDDPRFVPWRGAAEKRGIAAACGLPLSSSGQVLGALCIYSSQADAFSAGETALLQKLADNLAFGLAALRLQTERTRARQRYRDLFEMESDAIMLVDCESGHIVEANNSAAQLYGYDRGILLTKQAVELSAEPGATAEITRQPLPAPGTLFSVPLRLHRKHNGMTFPVEITGRYFMEAGRMVLIVAVRDITERKRAEEALRASERKLAEIFRSSPLLIGVTTLAEGRFIEANEAFPHMLGYERAEIIGRTSVEIGLWPTPADREAVVAQVKTHGQVRQFETRHRKKNGEIINVLLAMTPIVLEGQDCLITISADITGRKQAEADLKASEHRTRSIVESLPIGMHLYRLEGDDRLVFIGANQAADRILAMDHRQFVGKTIEEAFPPLAATEVPARYRAAATGQAWHTEQITYDDGTIRSAFNVDAFQFSPNHMVAAFEDITERKRTEAALLASERKLAEIFRSSPEMIVVTTVADGRVLELNEACARMLGYTREEMLGHTTLEINVWATPAERDRVIGLIRQGGQVQNLEVRFRRKNGDFIDVLLSMAPLQLEGQACLITLATEITAIKQAETTRREFERQLQHTQKLESLGVLAGGIAHDFNNLLMAILGNLDLALLDIPPASPARESIEQSVLAARRAADLTRQMLAYSGKGSFVIRSLDLNALVAENAHLFRACISRLIDLKVEITENLPAIRADAGQIQQVVMNLITNASEAIGDRPGRIRLHTGVTDCEASTLERSRTDVIPPAGRFVVLEVTDTGCGMDEPTQQKLFDPFFTTKFTGRGLGMSAILGIVRAHEGAIFVDSTVGQGSSIRVLFPAQADAMPPTLSPEASRPVPSPADLPALGTILIVDDEDIVRRVCKHMLTKQGWRVIEAVDGVQGLELFRPQPDAIACVILDLSMPNMGGIEVFRAMRLIRPDVRILLTSGYSSDQSTSAQLAGEGLAGFIQKPFTAQTLLHELERALKRP